jgi:type IV pilus biogenesis protein PilP
MMSFKEMPVKQKVTLAATVAVVLIVIWQVVGLFGSGSSTPTLPPATPIAGAMSANGPAAGNINPTTPGMPAAGAQLPATPANAVQVAQQSAPGVTPKDAPITRDQYLQEQDRVEKKYLKQLNDLEQLKLERQIEETNQAIATAKLATVTAEKSTADLLTKPGANAPPPDNSVYSSQLANPSRSGQPEAPLPVPVIETPQVAYTVISVSMQVNKWSAVIGAQGKLYNVTVGDVLPLDGSVITSINKNGVTLRNDGKSRKISITTAI